MLLRALVSRLALAAPAVRAALLAGLGVLSLGATGCVTSIEPDVSITPAPAEDAPYAHALAKATQRRVVLKDFETRYEVSATYLSPEFRTAFGQRLERVYKQGAGPFGEATAKAGFFISLHSPDDDRVDLGNPEHWTVLLTTPTGALKPILVKKLSDKERWRAFFDGVTQWTTEYLVVFDAPSVDTQSKALVEKSPMTLTFANADAQVSLAW